MKFALLGLSVVFLSLIYLLFLILDIFPIPRRFRKKKNVKGQIILITGAGSGVGRQLAIEFSTLSTCLVLLDINKESLLKTEQLLDPSSKAFVYECDVSDRRNVYEVAEHIKMDAGDVDIVINNAGIICGKYLLDMPDEKIVKTMEVNALAHFWICKAFLPAMMANDKGHIVSIVSIVGKLPTSRSTEYCASKYAATGFAECLEIELNERNLTGIKFTIVYPGVIDTGMLQGVEIKYSPLLNARYLAKEIVAGVLEERESVILPPIWKFVFMGKGFIPRWLFIWGSRMTGNIKPMSKFTGRTTNRNELQARPKLS